MVYHCLTGSTKANAGLGSDFLPMTAWTCETNEHYETVIQGSNGKKYHVTLSENNHGEYTKNWACDYPHFQHRLRDTGVECKHILKAQESHCGWNASLELDRSPTIDRYGNRRCPSCGGDVVPVSVAV